ncbi:MAG: hypothetical protein R8K22_01425, partial [Mariprofundaceae bacterium]
YGASLFYDGLESCSWSSGLVLRSLKLGVNGLLISVQGLVINPQTGLSVDVLDMNILPVFFSPTQKSNTSTASLFSLLSWLPDVYQIKKFSVDVADASLTGSSFVSLDSSLLLAEIQSSGSWMVHAGIKNDVATKMKGKFNLSAMASLADAWLAVKDASLQTEGVNLKLNDLRIDELQTMPEIKKGHIHAQLDSAQWPKEIQAQLSAPFQAKLAASVFGKLDDMVMNISESFVESKNLFYVNVAGDIRAALVEGQLSGRLQAFAVSGWGKVPDVENNHLTFNTKLDGNMKYQWHTGRATASFLGENHLNFSDWNVHSSFKLSDLDWNGEQLNWKNIQLTSSAKYQTKAVGSLFVRASGSSDLNNLSLQLQKMNVELNPSFPEIAGKIDVMNIRLQDSRLDYRQNGKLSWQLLGDVDMSSPSYVVKQASFHSNGAWFDHKLNLKSFSIDDPSNHMTSSLSGMLQVSESDLGADLSGDIYLSGMPASLGKMMPALKTTGDHKLHWQLQHDDSNKQLIKLSGKLTSTGVEVIHPKFSMHGFNMNVPFKQNILWAENRLVLQGGDSFSRLMISEQKEFSGNLGFDSFYVDKENWGDLKLGIDWRSGGLTIRTLDGEILGASLGGETRIVLPKYLDGDLMNQLAVHSRLNWVGIDSSILIGKESRGDQGRFNVFVTLHQQDGTLQGRFSVLEMGKKTALNMIDWIDPRAEDANAQNAKDMMAKFGFRPAGLDATLQDRYLDLDIALQSKSGKEMHIPVRNLAVTQFVKDMLDTK